MTQEELKQSQPLAYWKGALVDAKHLYYAYESDEFRLAVVYAKRKILFLERKALLVQWL